MYCIATIIGGDVSGLSEERVMRKFLFVLASTAPLAMMHPAPAQMYLPPSPGGGTFTSDYVPPPSYVAPAPGYGAPGYVAPAPGYVAPGYTNPGYTWREQRANEDWRNNTWREQRFDQDWRNNNWRTERANEDWRQRENYEKQRTPNNATDRGLVGATTDTRYIGECAIGSSEENCRRSGQRYNPPNNADNKGRVGSDGTIVSGAGNKGPIGSDATIINGADRPADRGYGGECPIGFPLETCRARGLRYD